MASAACAGFSTSLPRRAALRGTQSNSGCFCITDRGSFTAETLLNGDLVAQGRQAGCPSKKAGDRPLTSGRDARPSRFGFSSRSGGQLGSTGEQRQRELRCRSKMLVLESSKRADVRKDRGGRRINRFVFVRTAVSKLAEAMECSDF